MMIVADMASSLAGAPHIGGGTIVLRLLVASVLGAIIGLERQTHGRAAGLRTMMLVSLGCCLVMLVSNVFPEAYWRFRGDASNFIRIDPARLAYGVMAGIGFLGAGTILKSGGNIWGLTTGATIWCAAAIGLAVGMGMYGSSVATTALVLFALLVVEHLEAALPVPGFKIIEVVLPDQPDIVTRFAGQIEEHHATVSDICLERRNDGTIKATYTITLSDRKYEVPFFDTISRQPEVSYIQMR